MIQSESTGSVYDKAYRQRRAAGWPGWDAEESEYENSKALLMTVLEDLRLPDGAQVLELGCGAGNISLWLAEQGFCVTGIDVSQTALDWAKDRAAAAGCYCRFLTADVGQIEALPGGPYELIVDGHLFHCLDAVPRTRLLRLISKCLRPGGYFVLQAMCLSEQRNESSAVTHNMRYIDPPATLRNEVLSAGLEILHEEVLDPQSEQALLLLLARRPFAATDGECS